MSFLDAWNGTDEDNFADKAMAAAPGPEAINSPIVSSHADPTKKSGTYPVADWLANMMSPSTASAAEDEDSPQFAGYHPLGDSSKPNPVSAKSDLMSTVSNTDPVTDLMGLLQLKKQQEASGGEDPTTGPMTIGSPDMAYTPPRDPASTGGVKVPTLSTSVKPNAAIDVGKSRFNQEGLENAQHSQAGVQLAANLGKALNTIGAGITRTQVDPNQQKGFDAISQDAENITGNFKEQMAMEKNDPNSPISKAFRQYAKQLGQPINGDFSAADGEKMLPMIFKSYEAKLAQENQMKELKFKLDMHREEMAQKDKDRLAYLQLMSKTKGDLKSNQDQMKNYNHLTDLIQQSKSRGTIKAAYDTESWVNNAKSLLDEYRGNYNAMPQAQVNMLTAEIARIAKNGVAGDKDFAHMAPASTWSPLYKAVGAITNKPTGAGLAKFIQSYEPYLNDLQTNARKRIGNNIREIVENKRLGINDDQYNHVNQVNSRYLQYAEPISNGQQQGVSANGTGGGDRKVVRKGYNSTTDQTQLIYSDGSSEIKQGKI